MVPPVQVAVVGDNVTFDCIVSGTHPFTVMWSSDRVDVSEFNNSSTSDPGGDMVTVTLPLYNVTMEYFQTYVCSARSDVNNITFAAVAALLSKSTN